MIPAPRTTKPPKIQRISMRDWEAGIVSAFDDRRTPIKGLRSGENLILDQDGVVRQRWGLVKYGPQPLGEVLGELFEYKVTTETGSVNWLACLQNVGGTTNLYIAKGEDPSWTLVSGKTYHSTARGHFLQGKNNVLIMNGEDHLSFLDPTTSTITSFLALSDPASAPTLDTNTGLTGASFKVFYAITANSSIGQTKGSPVLEQAVLLDRDMWNPDTQSIKISWSAVTDAKSYNVYVGVGVDGGGQPTLYRIAQGIPPDQLTFTDNGTRALDETAPLPLDNSTAGPRARRGTVVNSRIWLVGDKDNPFRIWRGGDYGHELDFSPANGGGYSTIGSGTKEVPSVVAPYRDGKGEPKVMVLSQGTNGGGKRFFIYPSQVTFGNDTITVWEVQEDTGTDSTDSPDSLVIYNNDLHYLSGDGFKTTGTIPQLQAVLSTRRTSNTVQDKVSALNSKAIEGVVGVPFEGRLFWSVPSGSDENNQIWPLDLDRGGAWMSPWLISAKWLSLYNDNSGETHFLVVKSDGIYEFSKSSKSSDDGMSFRSSGVSGQILFSKEGRDWARLIRVIFVVMRPQGDLTITVNGRGEDGPMTFVEARNFVRKTTQTGWGQAAWGEIGWSDFKVAPVISNPATEEIEIEIDEDLQWAQYGWVANGAEADYAISDVIFEYVNIGTKDLS